MVSIDPKQVPTRKSTNYPEKFKHLVSGRIKKRLGDAAGLKNFGVNLVTLEPGSWSSIRHWHLRQDECIYVIEGPITLVTDEGEEILQTGAIAAFPAGEDNGHHLINNSDRVVTYLEIGDRTKGDQVTYPDADLSAKMTEQGWQFE
ncbi:MAG: cupin domain-containing protein [Cyanobacteria bacterium P01_F01_bin.143]